MISGLRRYRARAGAVYVGPDDVPKVQGGMGTTIVRPRRAYDRPRRAPRGVGGEVVADVW